MVPETSICVGMTDGYTSLFAIWCPLIPDLYESDRLHPRPRVHPVGPLRVLFRRPWVYPLRFPLTVCTVRSRSDAWEAGARKFSADRLAPGATMQPEPAIPDDAIFIPNLVEMVLGEDMFFEIAGSIELGPWDSAQGGYWLGCLTPREEAAWSLAYIVQHLAQFWTSQTVNRAAQWLVQPEAMDTLLEAVDEADYYQLPDRVRLAQRLAASALTEHLATEGLAISSPRIHLDYRALCRYLKTEAAVSDYLDLTYRLQEMSVESESVLALSWCITQLRSFWAAPPVARTLQWLTHSENILGALIASDYYLDADTPAQVSLVCHLVATVVERTEY